MKGRLNTAQWVEKNPKLLCLFDSLRSIVEYLETPTVEQATIAKSNFSPKGRSKSALNFLLINNCKSLGVLLMRFATVCDFTVICFKNFKSLDWNRIETSEIIYAHYVLVMQKRSKLNFFLEMRPRMLDCKTPFLMRQKKTKKLS